MDAQKTNIFGLFCEVCNVFLSVMHRRVIFVALREVYFVFARLFLTLTCAHSQADFNLLINEIGLKFHNKAHAKLMLQNDKQRIRSCERKMKQ